NVTFSNSGTKILSSGNFSVATTGVLTMGSSTILDANGNLTLKSDMNSSGTVAFIPPSSSIIGNVTVERFVQGGEKNPFRTYRMFSSPIYDNGDLSDRTYSFTQFIDNILITGQSVGFDELGNSGTSAWTYSDGYVAIPNISTSVPVGKGAYLLYRGNRSNEDDKVTTPYVDPENVVMDFKGVLNQKDVTVPLSYSATVSGFNLLGNPYASSIDWNSISSTQKVDLQDNVIFVFNPALRQYATYDGTTSANGGSNIIPAGQGFFVKAKSGGGSFTFTEDNKVGNMPLELLMAVPVVANETISASSGKVAMASARNFSSTNPSSELRAWLKKGNTPFKVETVVVFKDGTSADYVAKEDVSYTRGTEVYMSSLTDDKRRTVINYMPTIDEASKVALDLDTTNATGSYALELNYSNIPSGYVVKLTDNYLGTSALVDNGAEYNFTIDRSQKASAGASRFSVSFEAPVTLPVNFNTPFTVTKTNQGVVAKWSTTDEINNNRFEVERAGDDLVYEKLHIELAKGSGSSYSYTDRNPLIDNNYYRLVQFDNNSKRTVTLPQVVNFTGTINPTTDLISIFPNPVVSNFTVKFNGALKANQQTLKIVSATGQVLFTQSISKTQLTSGYDINIADFSVGAYIVEIYENGTQRVAQTKLIKQ
ncbi:MAG: T9SS type A sorting domain-containing protein, partial [Pedobacter sp.]